MKNPWLEIPLSDYESHMSLPEVAQAQLLAGIFSEHLAVHAPVRWLWPAARAATVSTGSIPP